MKSKVPKLTVNFYTVTDDKKVISLGFRPVGAHCRISNDEYTRLLQEALSKGGRTVFSASAAGVKVRYGRQNIKVI